MLWNCCFWNKKLGGETIKTKIWLVYYLAAILALAAVGAIITVVIEASITREDIRFAIISWINGASALFLYYILYRSYKDKLRPILNRKLIMAVILALVAVYVMYAAFYNLFTNLFRAL
ncbi:Uncharacterised protein [uncultured archaeon]|nr:Uncharacterised protein [uncultured archaeon]